MNHLTAKRIAEACTLAALCGALAVVIAHLPTGDVPLARPIASPLATLATSYCPRRLELFELRTAIHACLQMSRAACDLWHPADDIGFLVCMMGTEPSCTIGDTQEGWSP